MLIPKKIGPLLAILRRGLKAKFRTFYYWQAVDAVDGLARLVEFPGVRPPTAWARKRPRSTAPGPGSYVVIATASACKWSA